MSSSRRLPPRVVRTIQTANKLNNSKNTISKDDLIKYIHNRAKSMYLRYSLMNNTNAENNFNDALFSNRVTRVMNNNLRNYNLNTLRMAANHIKAAASRNSSINTAYAQMRNVESTLYG